MTMNILSKTVLHDWHANHGAKLVDFGGWQMPVQYPTGIIKEHLATRRKAGLFDVSHMGRFRIKGPDSAKFLQYVLTNNALALEPGQAQYTLIANSKGGAIDDAYLYRLFDDEFLLVVNAANRHKDWEWLQQHLETNQLSLSDCSEQLAMISLQGPVSEELLITLVGKNNLPPNKRNELVHAEFAGERLIVARTGYTGEAVCFELFIPSNQAVALWESLISAGATPVGLGARDSLRLEAGLPLYGHELGLDAEQQEIPVFAIDLARFAVRPAGNHAYAGQALLEQQRQELISIKRGELKRGLQQRLLPRLVMPIAAFGSRRPLRQGQKVFLGERLLGWVTSGTTVPYARFYGEGINAVPGEQHDLRAIGLALLDSDIRYRTDTPVELTVVDDRGNQIAAQLVEKNLWQTSPYVRAYPGFEAREFGAKAQIDAYQGSAHSLLKEARANTHWRRYDCINLIPSEQVCSEFVDHLCVADPASRYNEHNQLKSLGPNSEDVRYYKGTDFIMAKEQQLKAALRSFFNCSDAEPRVISGQMANDTVYDALKQFRNRFRAGQHTRPLDCVLVHDLTKGGHLSAQFGGALKNYVAYDANTGRPAVYNFPVAVDDPHAIDVEASKQLILDKRPDLIVFGRSVIIYREPVKQLAEFVFSEFGRDNPQRPLIMYDGAHVLGLLGRYFQDPLAEGADVVTGSTHKTFFGPQRGVVLTSIKPGSVFEPFWRQVQTRAFPGHVSNHHLGTMLGLLGACYEMLAFKDDYPAQVIRNAQAFAGALAEHNLSIEGQAAVGFTQTHQVLLRGNPAQGGRLAGILEANNIITNPQAFHDDLSFAAASGVRMGTSEMTRYGMQENDFRELAELIADILKLSDEKPSNFWRAPVSKLRARFTEMKYCFEA